MAQHTVTITAELTPPQITIAPHDVLVWINESQQVESVTSDDGGVTFTTGPIQVNSFSLPIDFAASPSTVPYTCRSGLQGIVTVEVHFETAVKRFFTEADRDAMNDPAHTFGIITFDLWSRDDCEANWQRINDAIANGRMPPPGDGGPWPLAKVHEFLTTFAAWKDGGFLP